ncbi:hypothetical protein PR048_015810 [Dryococelus australis]|uniref:Uncharacterized protein n=1 Tax=Dryococelus australis TaxID=614101 RepID=A0ABQ9HI20_9NEOP|nr:hypothetical protein PR048_015810 [Dryococelus australis]
MCFQADTPEENPDREQVQEIVQTGFRNISEKDTPTSPLPAKVLERTSKRKYNPMAEEAYSVMKQLGSKIKQKDDFDVFGENDACQLRKITYVCSQTIAKHRINQSVFWMEMPSFTIHSNSNVPSFSTLRPSSASSLSTYRRDPTVRKDSTGELFSNMSSLNFVEDMGLGGGG